MPPETDTTHKPTLRARAEAFVAREIEANVPLMFRRRAQLYAPLIVDRLVWFVSTVTSGGGDAL